MVFRGEEIEVETLRHAKSIAQKGGLKIGETFQILRWCGPRHRRRPNGLMRKTYWKVGIRKVCSGCYRILRSRTRIVGKTSRMAYISKHEEGPCDSPYCQEASKFLSQLPDGKKNMASVLLSQWESRQVFRTSEFPEMEKFRYTGTSPSCIIYDRGKDPMSYIPAWYNMYEMGGCGNLDHSRTPPTPQELAIWEKIDNRVFSQENKKESLKVHPDAALERFLDENQLDGYDPFMSHEA
jgi:hypothetical protein